jgi:hypothetical protein
MIKRSLWFVLLVVVIAACSTPSPAPSVATTGATNAALSPTNTPSPSPIPPTATNIPPTITATATATEVPLIASGPDNFPEDINPLTGIPVSDPSVLDRRPVAVKIQTYPRGQRPPWGVTLADIVYDYYQNNGLTRLTAIFYANDAEQVGPIRSGRLFDGSIVSMYKPIFAFGSADRRILNRLYNSGFSDQLVIEGAQNCPPMCRIEPNTFNFLMTNTDELRKYASANGVENERQDLNGMSFDPQTASGGEPGEQIFTRYSISAYSRWDYDEQEGHYLLFEDTQEDDSGQGEAFQPFMDRLVNEQVTADNVVILYAPHQYTYKSGNSEIVDILMSGSGTAYAFRDGQVYEVEWNRPKSDAALFLTFPDGSAYPFKPGNTWFQVMGQSSKVEDQGSGAWRFTFGFP